MRDFMQIDPLALARDALTQYQADSGITLFAGDERRILLNTAVYIATIVSNKANYLMNQNFVQYAEGTFLDLLGGSNTPRLAAMPAKTILRFFRNVSQSDPITIPAGTRATSDGQTFFATDVSVVLSENYVDVPATATTRGASVNNLIPGSINILVDMVANVIGVQNTTVTGNGADAESDDGYRVRIIARSQSNSTAGPRGAYIYFAKSADARVDNAQVISPNAGEVNVYITQKNTPNNSVVVGSDLIAIVNKALNADTVRPLTDYVRVLAPIGVPQNITLNVFVRPSDLANIGSMTNVAQKIVSDTQYAASHTIGVPFLLDNLKTQLYNAGFVQINSTPPTLTLPAVDGRVYLLNITLTVGSL